MCAKMSFSIKKGKCPVVDYSGNNLAFVFYPRSAVPEHFHICIWICISYLYLYLYFYLYSSNNFWPHLYLCFAPQLCCTGTPLWAGIRWPRWICSCYTQHEGNSGEGSTTSKSIWHYLYLCIFICVIVFVNWHLCICTILLVFVYLWISTSRHIFDSSHFCIPPSHHSIRPYNCSIEDQNRVCTTSTRPL